MTPDVPAFLQRVMCLSDHELAEIMQNPSELEALLDVVFDGCDTEKRPDPTHLASKPHISVKDRA
jgi:hypothetical protein